MAKIYGLQGVMSGKLGNSVMAVRNGEQIVRQYQPIVANPNTLAQIETRAKLKLLSQFSAILAPAIAFRRSGAISSRNLFVKKNYASTSFVQDDNKAEMELGSIDLTGGVLGLPDVTSTRENFTVTPKLAGSAADIDKVVYAIVIKRADNSYSLAGMQVVDKDAENPDFTGEPMSVAASFGGQVYAYGVRTNTDSARVRFGELTAGDVKGFISVLIKLSESDVTLTETQSSAFNAYSI